MEELQSFIRSLLNAGMSPESAVEHGFKLAMELCSTDQRSVPRSKKEQLMRAAKLLEQAQTEKAEEQ